MINNLRVSGVHTKVTDETRAYAEKKIGGLFKYIPKDARESAHIDVKLKEAKSANKMLYECEVLMKLPKGHITAHRKSTAILAAIDEVEDNLINQLKRYKNTHAKSRLQRHVMARFRRREQETVTRDIAEPVET